MSTVQDYSHVQKDNLKAFDTTLNLYLEFRSSLGPRSTSAEVLSRRTADMGFSTDRIIRTCPADYIADVEKAVRRVELTAAERIYVRERFDGKEDEQTWLYHNATAAQFRTISDAAKMLLGLEFRDVGVHPYALYRKTSDMR